MVKVGSLALLMVLVTSCGLIAEQPLENQSPDAATGAALTPNEDAGPCSPADASEGIVWSDPSSDSASSVSADWVAAQCARAACSPVAVTSTSAMQTILTRSWARCSSLGLFHVPHDGIQINADGTYAFLAWSGASLIPESGDTYAGTVEYVDTSAINGKPTIQVNFESPPEDAGRGFIVSDPQIDADPPLLTIDNNGVETYRYLALP
jgi:hypothetical protein